VATGALDTAIATRRDAFAARTKASRLASAASTVAILAVSASVILVAHVLLERLQAAGVNIRINAAPLVGTFQFRPSARLVPAAAVGAVVVFVWPRLVRRVGWRALLLGTATAATAWAVSLALVDGWQGLTHPLQARTEYLTDVGSVGSPGAFLSTFVDRISDYSIHVQGHPPALLLALSGLDRVGLGGAGWTAVLFVGGGVAAVPAVLMAVREVAGESVARQAAPFLVVAPAALWVASSADAFYTGVSAWAVTLVVLATGRRGRRSDAYALTGGLLFGVTAFLSYGLVLLGIVPAVVAWQRRRLRPVALAAIGAAPVFLGFVGAGFWWVAGLIATRERYFAGVGSRRPYLEFLVANAACLAIVLGPAVVVALARLRNRLLWLLVGGALAAVGAAMISGMSKGEVERIWLPFVVWLLPAGAVLARGKRRITTNWLGFQAATSIAVTSVVKTSW
jgi:methylthioxylose transferase